MEIHPVRIKNPVTSNLYSDVSDVHKYKKKNVHMKIKFAQAGKSWKVYIYCQ